MAEYHPLRTNDQNPRSATYAQHNADAERRAKECRSAQMPSLKHLKMRDYDNVYEPSDDTYLLIDAIGMDMDIMKEQTHQNDDTISDGSNIKTTLEIGCGTGVPSVYLAMRLRGMAEGDNNSKDHSAESQNEEEGSSANTTTALHYVTDINSDAIRVAKSTAETNGIPSSDFQAFQCDLASDILEQLQNKVDILIFNPPYVPTPNEEVGSDGIEASWAGGENGRVVLDRALPQIAQLLAHPHGVAYIVAVDDNYPEQISEMMKENYGIDVVPWLRRRARNEFLTILKMTPTRAFCSHEKT
mmetsp:Transcript_22040/g.46492  ORF Transcript_22040/g.46492 Transcript_22040/m.46492 type:complete len:300 (+) Transcript_22040:67-966(+)